MQSKFNNNRIRPNIKQNKTHQTYIMSIVDPVLYRGLS